MTPSAVLLSPKRQDKSPVVPREEALAIGGPPVLTRRVDKRKEKAREVRVKKQLHKYKG